MLNAPANTLQHSSPVAGEVACESAALSSDSSLEPVTKPVRKRAARKPRTGVCKGMMVTLGPTPAQEILLRQWTGATRWVWNWALAQQNDHYAASQKHVSAESLSKVLTQTRKDGDLAWLQEVPATCLSRTLNHLQTGWGNFFEGVSGKRAGAPPGKPVFRRKWGSRESLAFQVDPRHQSKINLQAKTLTLTGIGAVRAYFTETIHGDIAEVVVTQRAGRWFASLSLVNVPAVAATRRPEKVKSFTPCPQHDFALVGLQTGCPECEAYKVGLAGLDASVPHGLVGSSNGSTTYSLVDAAFRASQDAKLARSKTFKRRSANQFRHRMLEAGLDPKKKIPKGTKLPKSNRQLKNDVRAKVWDLKALFARNDLIHKFTTDLVRNHHTIVVEALMLSYMAKSLNKGFRRRFHEAAMGEILRQLDYKCAWYGRTLIKVDRWFPSSKRCSNPVCHQKNTELKLKDRAWVCRFCHTAHERDSNAAFNLWQEGWRLLQLMQQQQSTSCPTVGVHGGCTPRVRGKKAAAPGFSQPHEVPKCEKSSNSPFGKPGMEPGAARVA